MLTCYSIRSGLPQLTILHGRRFEANAEQRHIAPFGEETRFNGTNERRESQVRERRIGL